MNYTVDIENSNGDLMSVDLLHGQNLSEVLTAANSPVLFGCRTGVCGTCCVQVIEGIDNLSPADDDENEIIEIYGEGRENIRLGCQLKFNGNAKLKYVGK